MNNYKKKTLEGIGWYGGLQIGQRVFGYLKIGILARVLTPKQFGLFGVAGLVLAFLEIFTQTGINVFLIQNESKLDKYLDTAFVISIVRGLVIGALIIFLTPLISSFFKAEVNHLLYLISIVPILRGFINPAIIKFKKDLIYKTDVMFHLGLFVVDAMVVVAFAISNRSETSFVYGMIAAALMEVFLSHLLVKETPKIKVELNKFKEIIKSGKWVTFAGIMNYLISQLDDIVVGRLLVESSLGIYQSAYKISTLPMTEVTQVINKTTFPVLSKSKENLTEFKEIILKTSVAVILLAIAIGSVVYLFPTQIVLIILGENWLEAVPVLRILAVFGLLSAINSLPSSLLLALKKQDVLFYVNLIQLAVLAFTIYPLVKVYGIIGAAYSATASVLLVLPFTVYFTYKVLKSLPSFNE